MDLASGPGRERRSDERGPAAGGESGRALGLRGRRALAGRGGVGRAWEQGGVGRARKGNRGTGLGPREEGEGREVGRGEAGSG